MTVVFNKAHGRIYAHLRFLKAWQNTNESKKNPLGVAVLNSISAKYQLEVGELGDFSLTSSYETIGYYGIFEFPTKFPVHI